MDGAKAAAWVPAKASGRGGGQLRPHAHTVPSLASAQEPWLPAASVTCGDRFCHHSAAKRTSNGGSRLTHGACAAEAAFASVRSASGWLARASAPRATSGFGAGGGPGGGVQNGSLDSIRSRRELPCGRCRSV